MSLAREAKRVWSVSAAVSNFSLATLALSRTDPASVSALADWVTRQLARFRSGGLVPVDPGPMAAHAHAHAHELGRHLER